MATCEKIEVKPVPPPPAEYHLTLSEDEAQYIAALLTVTYVDDDGLGTLDANLHATLCDKLAPLRGLELADGRTIQVVGWAK